MGKKRDLEFYFLKRPKNFKKIKDENDIEAHCYGLYVKYIQINSKFELNISAEDRKRYAAVFEHSKHWDMNTAYSTLNSVQQNALNVMGDSYFR